MNLKQNHYKEHLWAQKRHLSILKGYLDSIKTHPISDKKMAISIIEESISEYNNIARSGLWASEPIDCTSDNYTLTREEMDSLIKNINDGRKLLDQITSITIEKLQS